MKLFMELKKTCSVLLIASVCMIGLFTGCDKPHYNQLTPDEMTWLAYQNNQVLKYGNGSGDIMNYYVTLRTKAYENEGSTYNEFTSASFLQLHDTIANNPNESKGELFIYKSELGLEVTFSWPHFALSGIKLTNILPTIENIAGETYTDMYRVDASVFTSPSNYIAVMWVSKSKGVIQFEDIHGGVWIREF